MISRSPTHLCLGLRISGLFELVDLKTGEVSFVEQLPLGLTAIDITINPLDIPFSSRPPAFLSDLRAQRLVVLEKARKTRKLSKEHPHGATSSPKRRPLSASIQLSLSTKFSPDEAARIAELLRGGA